MKKYILLIDYPGNGDPQLHYYDKIGEVINEITTNWISQEDDLEHVTDLSNEEVSDRLRFMDVKFHIYEYGESDPFATLTESDEFQQWLLMNIKESKISNFRQFNEAKKDKFPNLKKVSVDGFVVYIGKDALSNDHLTFNMSDPDDYWFHAKGVPGSHVVIRVRDKLPTKEVIREVAKIAAKNSKSTDKDNKVVYCKIKFVKKEKGMNPGQVKVDNLNAEEIVI